MEAVIGPDGTEQYGVRKRFNTRGTRYSLPKPKVHVAELRKYLCLVVRLVRTADCLHVKNLRDPHLFVWCSFQSYACTFVRFVSSSEARHVQCPVMLPIITIMSVISISVQWNSTLSDIQCSIS